MTIDQITNEYGNAQIARGAFGTISLAVLTPNPNSKYTYSSTPQYSYVALKTIQNALCPSQDANDSSSKHKLTLPVFTELAALRALSSPSGRHENVTPLLSILSNNFHDITFVFPYCPIDLHEIIQSHRFSLEQFQLLPNPIIRTVMKDILRGLQHIHSVGIIHCDLKPGNVLFSSKGTFQLADFGLAQLSNDESKQSAQTVMGLCTLSYRPPEILYGCHVYKPSVDIWGAGLVLCEMLSGRALFYGNSVLDQLCRIIDILGTPTVDNWQGLNDLPDYGKVIFEERSGVGLGMVLNRVRDDALLENFVNCMVVLDPGKRCSAKECFEHDWMQGEVCSRQHMYKTLVPNEFTSVHDGCNVTDLDEGMKQVLLEQMKLKGAEIALAKRKSSNFSNIASEDGSSNVDCREKVKVSNDLAGLLSSRMRSK